jgi:hypothetical protein
MKCFKRQKPAPYYSAMQKFQYKHGETGQTYNSPLQETENREEKHQLAQQLIIRLCDLQR